MTVFGDLEISTLTELPAGRAPIQTNVVPLADAARAGSTGSGSGSARRSTRATRPTSSARGSPATSSSRARPTSSTSTRTATAAGRRRRRWPPSRSSLAELAEGPLAGLRVGDAARPDAAGRQGPHDAGLRRRRDRRARLHHRHRGRRRRRQRHRDGDPRRRPVRRLPAPPAPRPGRPGRPPRAVPAGQPRRGRQPGAERLDAVAATTDGFELSRIDLEQRREGDVLGAQQSGLPLQPAEALRCCATRTTIVARPRGRRRRSSPPTPTLGRSPAARRGGGRLEQSGSLSSWRSHDAPTWRSRMTRIIGGTAGGRRLTDPAGRAHPADQRPGARGAVLGASRPGAARWPGSASSTCTPAPARSASRRWSRGAGVVTLSSPTGAPPR